MKYSGLLVSALIALAACSKATDAPDGGSLAETSTPVTAPAGEYRVDPEHAALVFRISHLDFSWYTASFPDFEATLDFDPAAPETMSVEAVINVRSLTIPHPRAGFRETLLGPDYLNADAFPEMKFRSTKVTVTGDRTATVVGDFTMLGVTKPVTLNADFIGGYPGFHPHDPQARIGFSVGGTLKRSDFGMTNFLAAPGEPTILGDEISFRIDAEMLGPPTPKE